MIVSDNQEVTNNYTVFVYRKHITMAISNLEYLEWEIEIDHFRYLEYGVHPSLGVIRVREATHYLYTDHIEMKEFDKWKEARVSEIEALIISKEKEKYLISETHVIVRNRDIKTGKYFSSGTMVNLAKEKYDRDSLAIDILEEYDYDSKN